ATDQAHGTELWAYHPATHFQLSTASQSVLPAEPVTITVTALDSRGQPDTTYAGTVQFSSTDNASQLPASYEFTSGDEGTHQFTFPPVSSGLQTITVADTHSASVLGMLKLNVLTDISRLINLSIQPAHRVRNLNLFDGSLILENPNRDAIAGPIFIVLKNLSSGAILMSASLGNTFLPHGLTALGEAVI